MVNIGRPSKGCALCRKRRIKCTEERPECSRCITHGKPCPGYRLDEDLLFRSENDRVKVSGARGWTAENDSKVSRASIAHSTSSMSPCVKGNSSNDNSATSSPGISLIKVGSRFQHDECSFPEWSKSTSILPSLLYDLREQAVCMMTTEMVVPARLTDGPDRHPGWMPFLPDLYAHGDPSGALHKAVRAISQATFSNRIGVSSIMVDAALSYGEALEAVNEALEDPAEALKDETLMAVFLLALYEIVVGHISPHEGTHGWWSHADGTMLLLRMRGMQQLSTPRGTMMFRMVHSPIQVRALSMGLDPPDETMELTRGMPETDPMKAANLPPMRTAFYFFGVTKLCAKIRRLLDNPDTLTSSIRRELLGFVVEGERLENNMNGWWEGFPEWKRHLVTIPDDSFAAASASNTWPPLYYYANIWSFGNWTKYYSGRTVLHETLLECIQRARLDLPTDSLNAGSGSGFGPALGIAHHRAIIQETADAILGSIPYAMGEVDAQGQLRKGQRGCSAGHSPFIGALTTLWQLGVLMRSSHVTASQKELTKEALHRAGHEYGIRMALVYLGSTNAVG